MQTKVKPKNNNVILLWEKADETVTEFGLVIPKAKRRDEYAEVIAVSDTSELEVGMKVVFNKAAGHFFKEDLNEFLIINEKEIYAVIEE